MDNSVENSPSDNTLLIPQLPNARANDSQGIRLTHYPVTRSLFIEEMLDGLSQTPKRIPSKFFYDERGSKLFEEITALEEYYLTRTELAILQEHLPEMAALIGPNARIIEFGTGAGIKTRLLLEALDRPAAYVPIDISRQQLLEASHLLIERFPALEVTPICADYTQDFTLPHSDNATGKTVIFFPGSTIGNFTPEEAIDFLRNARERVEASEGTAPSLLIGFDPYKDRATLEAAYNDAQGLTAAFNLNLITRLATEAVSQEHGEPAIQPGDFEHAAHLNTMATHAARIEMHLIARRDLHFRIDGKTIACAKGEHIITEFSYKYTDEQFDGMVRSAGFVPANAWADTNRRFRVWFCTAN